MKMWGFGNSPNTAELWRRCSKENEELTTQGKRERDNTRPKSATESASTRASSKRDASLGVEATLADRDSHENLSSTNCV